MTTKLRAAGLVAAVYGHFLIFAQFSFVELMRAAGVATGGEQLALAAMAVAGAAAGFLAAHCGASPERLRLALVAGAAAAAVAPWAAGFPACLFVALLAGAAIGTSTVNVAALLPRWCPVHWVGLGTGLGYALCNLPGVFDSAPAAQSLAGAAFAATGALLVPPARPEPAPVSTDASATRPPPWWPAVAAFLALVWLDSAAFFIIQHQAAIKAETWGAAMLWRNAALHLAAALAAGAWLARARWQPLVVTAWALLAVAALAANDPASTRIAGWFYPVAVSLYSTALVAWPGFLSHLNGADPRRLASSGSADVPSASSPRSPLGSLPFLPDSNTPRQSARRAAWLFAVAGWFGSANGIGMAATLARIPAGWIAAAGIVVVAALVVGRRWRIAAAPAAVAAAALLTPAAPPPADPLARGRQVYLAEGCIACHSRYVRPDDPPGWGPPSDPVRVLDEKPVLIGNRRHGPDLRNVGARRSPAWLREHFLDPRQFIPNSTMPSYRHLFCDSRGDDLIAWLRADSGEALVWRIQHAAGWQPAGPPAGDGRALFASHCAACHGPAGRGDGPLADRFIKRPANLAAGPFVWTTDLTTIARTIKWGLPATDMPGHELLADPALLALAAHVLELRRPEP